MALHNVSASLSRFYSVMPGHEGDCTQHVATPELCGHAPHVLLDQLPLVLARQPGRLGAFLPSYLEQQQPATTRVILTCQSTSSQTLALIFEPDLPVTRVGM